MQATIIGIRQELSFEDGVASNYMVLRLPSGDVIQTLIDDDTVRALTVQFVQEGGIAAERAVAEATTQDKRVLRQDPVPAQKAHPALVHSMDVTQEDKEIDGDHTPLRLADDTNSDYVFGSSADMEYPEEDIQGIQQQFRAASDRIIGAVENSSSLTEVAKLLGSDATLPIPSWAADGAQTEKAPAKKTRSLQVSHASPVALASAVQVEADSMGNPVLKGEGLVDPYALTSYSDEDGEAGQL